MHTSAPAPLLAVLVLVAVASIASSTGPEPTFATTPDPPQAGSPLHVRLVNAPSAANATLHTCMAKDGVVGVCFRPVAMTREGDDFVATSDALLDSPQVGVNADVRLANGTLVHYPRDAEYVFLAMQPPPVRGVPAPAFALTAAAVLATALASRRT